MENGDIDMDELPPAFLSFKGVVNWTSGFRQAMAFEILSVYLSCPCTSAGVNERRLRVMDRLEATPASSVHLQRRVCA